MRLRRKRGRGENGRVKTPPVDRRGFGRLVEAERYIKLQQGKGFGSTEHRRLVPRLFDRGFRKRSEAFA